jgi:plastocyanin
MSRATIILPLAASALLAGCGGGGSKDKAAAPPSGGSAGAAPAVASARVEIASYKYKPASVTVKAGGKVTWTNSDADKHTATAKPDGATFDTDTLAQGRSRTVTLNQPGIYRYYCVYHAFMQGTVIVK